MIEVSELVKDYGFFRAVDHISFEVEPGEIVGFLGPNGAGKTTTLRVLTGYHSATSGLVRVHGRDVLSDSLQIRAGLGYLPENVPIYPDLRVQEYLSFRAAAKGVERRQIKTRLAEIMELAGVSEVRRKLVGQVSRGYRQRVGLADVLISNPPLLILDEPTSGLDPNQRRRVRQLIRDLRGRHTILLSSHILADVEAVCDRIVLIHRGRLRADDSVERLGWLAGRELRLCVRIAVEEIPALLEGLPFAGTGPPVATPDGYVSFSCPLIASGDGQDEEERERELLDACARRIRDRGLALRELHLHKPSLEEIFYHLTEKDDDGVANPSREQVA
ncbi:MAG: ABC transporter ATP-binding protein [Planctomycetota bacterium]